MQVQGRAFTSGWAWLVFQATDPAIAALSGRWHRIADPARAAETKSLMFRESRPQPPGWLVVTRNPHVEVYEYLPDSGTGWNLMIAVDRPRHTVFVDGGLL